MPENPITYVTEDNKAVVDSMDQRNTPYYVVDMEVDVNGTNGSSGHVSWAET